MSFLINPFLSAPVVVYASFNGVASSQVTLSNSNLTATINTALANIGARSASVITTGKYYFEITSGPIAGGGCGLLTSAGSYGNMINSGTNCLMAVNSAGTVYSNGSNTSKAIGTYVSGDVICFAVDLDARKAWIRKNGASWFGDAAANPATGTNGVVLYSSVSFSPAVSFGSGAAVGNSFTLNCGKSAYAQTVPSGFGNWPG